MNQSVVGLVALTLGAATFTVAGPAPADHLLARCLDTGTVLSVEESRLTAVLPDNADPSRPQSMSFAQQMIIGGGLQSFGPAFTRKVCDVRSLHAATVLARQEGERLWQAAVRRA